MAPPRQRMTVVDDSRSEASSGMREKTTTAKGRKTGGSAVNSASRDKNSGHPGATSAPAVELEDLPKIPWTEMPLDLLHSYRHAYKVPAPSAFSTEYSHILLKRGIGLRSPTSIAAQRAQLQSKKDKSANGVAKASRREGRIAAQGRVGKNQLALAVRKHFNDAMVPEQEAIARFLYKVREDGRGRQFRLRFQP